MTTMTYTGTLSIAKCANCGITFAMPDAFERARRNDHKTFYCPQGHSNYYPHKSDEELLKEEQKRTERLRSVLADEREQHQHTTKRLNATRGVVTRIKKRVAAGVCPAGCNRHFTNLERHMHSQHPDYKGETLP